MLKIKVLYTLRNSGIKKVTISPEITYVYVLIAL